MAKFLAVTEICGNTFTTIIDRDNIAFVSGAVTGKSFAVGFKGGGHIYITEQSHKKLVEAIVGSEEIIDLT